ncbi:hypothetical protein [Saccharicrinis aurantiacus]|uniref:hypothetical protein n=1 Tax=Saccharicrinis aurantiacus TaxID=1849719 RepID=UPI00111533E4|nr:hypothetical protein [Saccharicrinis aurantiacus]
MSYFATHNQSRYIKLGRFVGSKQQVIGHHNYYIEEVKFKSSHESLHNFYQIVYDIAKYNKVLEVKYDLYDWTHAIYRFEDATIGLSNLRSLSKVRLVKSEIPLSIDEFELDNPGLK